MEALTDESQLPQDELKREREALRRRVANPQGQPQEMRDQVKFFV